MPNEWVNLSGCLAILSFKKSSLLIQLDNQKIDKNHLKESPRIFSFFTNDAEQQPKIVCTYKDFFGISGCR